MSCRRLLIGKRAARSDQLSWFAGGGRWSDRLVQVVGIVAAGRQVSVRSSGPFTIPAKLSDLYKS